MARLILYYVELSCFTNHGPHADSDPNDLVFMPNATTGTNTVVMSCVKNMKPGDSIVTLNTAYGTCMSFVLCTVIIYSIFRDCADTVRVCCTSVST
jgi:hypothetical protein